MRKNNKKGISPLIATVLIIGFTIVLAALVITWGTKLFKTTVEQTESASKFSFACSTGLKLEVLNAEFDDGTNPTKLNIKMRNNNQDLDISNFKFVLNSDTGSEEVSLSDVDATPVVDPALVKLEFPVPKTYGVADGTTVLFSDANSVSIYPAFEIENEEKFCESAVNVKV